MKAIKITVREAKAFSDFDTSVPASAGHLLIEIHNPDNLGGILVGVVHPHRAGEGVEFHRGNIEIQIARDKEVRGDERS